ncbi:2-octaprenyl-6-methoxyphenyl hydroxylase [Acuticoccus sediminis]|uniref:2-octaprenyl-6-methoxyphenyl hydroxylase n=1 Tax=Acuticoccus sediminis TaxID=2184697 RepID=A0A8B2NZ23_9HYPH|nr:FAD-dependent monooxygenase [Acuticoccus sediminis]RAI03126.1 2-octaprenyl-6-methoxyphenyl hydroxylase [Acuticoccus sediminis]
MGRTIAIAGGGIVGRTLAVALASQSHLTVHLIAGPAPGRDERSSAIAASARRMLARTGVWPAVAADAEPMRGMVITDSADGDLVRPEVLTFEGDTDGHPFAHMVPNETLYRSLVARCAALGIRETSAVATFYEEDERSVTVELSDGTMVTADVLVAADGRNSKMRQITGIEVVRKDYHQSGVTGTVSHELDHGGIATQHFLPAGPFAMLPLTGRRSSIVWSERPAFAASLAEMDPLLAALEIERVFGLSLGRITLEGPLQAYPLVAQMARDLVAGRVVLAGDAAHVIHPLAGQGLNLGLRDAAVLAEELIDAARIGADPMEGLPRYSKRRRADTVQMALVTDGLNAIFSRKSDLLRAARSVALGVVEERNKLKSLFMREAAGLEGELPRLMRGEAI